MSQRTITTRDLRNAISAIHENIDTVGQELNELDGQLGDGDLGVTLINGFNNMQEASPELPDDIGLALFDCAKAMTKVSGSSFGTLMATALMASAKLAKGKEQLPLDETPALLQAALDAMIARGGASLGDKTVLDVLNALINATSKDEQPASYLDAMLEATEVTLSEFKEKTCKIGRARIFGERTIGMDDPGMVAVLRMLQSIKSST